mgnify:CR=1 FL=1
MNIGMICGALVNVLIDQRAKQTTKYLTNSLTVKATHRGTWDARDGRNEILLTWGKPNWKERRFLTDIQRAGEPLPVKKIQIKR